MPGLLRCMRFTALLCVLAAPGASVLAVGFQVNDQIRGAWNNTIAAGAALRANDPDAALVGFNNAARYPGARGAVSVADDGNLNFRKGDVVSAPLLWLSDLEIRYRNQYGLFVRARAWYDIQLEGHGVPHGHTPNGYVPGAKLDDSNFYNANKFSGAELLDAYVYGNFDLASSRLSLRLGQQTVNWGEGLLYTGISAINPVNVGALGRPGSRVEDAFIPVNRVLASWVGESGLSVEAFYALAWRRSTLPSCGTLGGAVDSQGDPGCNFATGAVGLPDRVLYTVGLGSPVLPPIDGDRGGQYGIAARYFVEALSTEFGVYYARVNNTLQSVNIIPNSPAANPLVKVALQNEYINGSQDFALSATTGVRNVALSTELSYFKDMPVQRNFPTLVQGALGKGGPYADAAGYASGQVYPGYVKVDRTQLLLGARIDLSPVVALADASLTAETALQWTNAPSLDVERIGRNPNFGTASYQGSCEGGYNVCDTSGFLTSFAWGYRLLAQFSLPRPATGLDLQPVLFWSQDVSGYSADGSLVEGRYVAALLLRAVYQQFVFAELGRTWIRQDTAFDPLRDKQIWLFTLGVRF